jgi:hypothetical protein
MQAAKRISRLALPPGPIEQDLPMSCSIGRGVICVHCGVPVPLTSRRGGATGQVSLVWCPMGLREAAYRIEDITDL